MFSGMVRLLSGLTTLELHLMHLDNMINNECIKGEEDEQIFSGSRIRR